MLLPDLGPLLAALGPLLAAPGRSRAALGPLLAALGPLLAAPGRSRAALGLLLAALGPLLAALGAILGRSWALLGHSWGAKSALKALSFQQKRNVHETVVKQTKNTTVCYSWPLLGCSWPLVAALGALLVCSGCTLGRSSTGCSWVLSGRSSPRLECPSGAPSHSWTPWGGLGTSTLGRVEGGLFTAVGGRLAAPRA